MGSLGECRHVRSLYWSFSIICSGETCLWKSCLCLPRIVTSSISALRSTPVFVLSSFPDVFIIDVLLRHSSINCDRVLCTVVLILSNSSARYHFFMSVSTTFSSQIILLTTWRRLKYVVSSSTLHTRMMRRHGARVILVKWGIHRRNPRVTDYRWTWIARSMYVISIAVFTLKSDHLFVFASRWRSPPPSSLFQCVVYVCSVLFYWFVRLLLDWYVEVTYHLNSYQLLNLDGVWLYYVLFSAAIATTSSVRELQNFRAVRAVSSTNLTTCLPFFFFSSFFLLSLKVEFFDYRLDSWPPTPQSHSLTYPFPLRSLLSLLCFRLPAEILRWNELQNVLRVTKTFTSTW